MDITEKLKRSKSKQKIKFDTISCLHHPDRLVRVTSSDTLLVEPIWEVAGDHEGSLYAAYRKTHPDYDGVYIRSSVLQRLEEAAKSLDGTYQLVLRAGHRPMSVQKQLLHEATQNYVHQYPHVTEAEALAYARLYVSDPATTLPPHCCGAAVDVTLYDPAAQTYVDFGSPMNQYTEVSHLHTSDITPAQAANRHRLLTAMLDAGFASYRTEWWHYSYGDEVWAWFYGKDACLFGVIEK